MRKKFVLLAIRLPNGRESSCGQKKFLNPFPFNKHKLGARWLHQISLPLACFFRGAIAVGYLVSKLRGSHDNLAQAPIYLKRVSRKIYLTIYLRGEE